MSVENPGAPTTARFSMSGTIEGRAGVAAPVDGLVAGELGVLEGGGSAFAGIGGALEEEDPATGVALLPGVDRPTRHPPETG